MKKTIQNLLFGLFLFLIGGVFSVAKALEPLTFSDKVSPAVLASLHGYLEEASSDYLFASVDLNDDGLDEVVSVAKSCKAQTPKRCNYTVFGRGDSNAHILLQVEAWNMSVADHSFSGVRQLMIFKSRNNQFKPSPYTWNALKSRYTEDEGDEQT